MRVHPRKFGILLVAVVMAASALTVTYGALGDTSRPLRVGTAGETQSEKTGNEINVTGQFVILWGDGPIYSQDSTMGYFLIDDSGAWLELNMEAAAEGFTDLLLLNGRRVSVAGNLVSATPLKMEVEQILNDVSKKSEPVQETVEGVTGPQKYVSILCRFADMTSTTPRPPSYFDGLMSNTAPGLDHYWRELSFGNVSLAGSVTAGWYNLPQPRSYYVYDKNSDGAEDLDFARLTNDCASVADPNVYFPDFAGVNFIVNGNLNGFAWGGGTSISKDGLNNRFFRATWIPEWGLANQSVMAHEIGHSLGLPHSSGPYASTYDSEWDVMSNTYRCSPPDPVYNCVGPHTIAYHKDLLGWVPAGRKYSANAGTTATIDIERLAQPASSSNFMMAQIPIGGSSNKFYTVETRIIAGYDNNLPGEAIVLHSIDRQRGRPAQVVDPDNNEDPNDAAAMWLPGETFTDAPHGIQVSVISKTASSFKVTITSSCNYSISSSNRSAPSGGVSGTVNVTATSNCVWESRVSNFASWVTITGGATGVGNGIVSYAVAPNPDPFSRTATLDIAGQVFTITQAPNYVISGTVTDPTGNAMPGVSLALTGSQTGNTQSDSTGKYSFSNLTAGGNYTVTPSKSGFGFLPPSTSLSNLSFSRIANFVGRQNTNVSITLSDSPDPVSIGQNLTYTATVRNLGPAQASGLILSEILPSGVSFVSASATQGTLSTAGSGGTSYNIPTARRPDGFPSDLPLEESGNVVTQNYLYANNNFLFQSSRSFGTTRTLDNAISIYRNYFTSRGWSVISDSSAATSRVLYVAKAGIYFQAQVYEDTTTHAKSVSLYFLSNGLVWNGGNLSNGASATITMVVKPSAAGGLTNLGFVGGNEIDTDSNNNSATANTTVNSQNQITIQTNPAGRTFTVDGTSYSTTQTFSWIAGSSHVISTTSPQSGASGTRYVWSSWSDGGAMSHSVVAPSSGTTYTANFTTQYLLTTSAGTGGSVSPPSGYFNSGQSVSISATPNGGYNFGSWTGVGPGSFSGSSNPASVTMNAPITETANFVSAHVIFTEVGTNNVAAVDSVTFVRGPFRLFNPLNFSADQRTRIIFFTSDLGLTQHNPSVLSVQASGVPLTVERVGPLLGVPSLSASYIVVRLPDGLPTGNLQLTVTLNNVTSNPATLSISP